MGAGDFGRFCLHAFRKLPNLRLAAVYDADARNLGQAAAEFGLTPYTGYEDLLADPSVGLVAPVACNAPSSPWTTLWTWGGAIGAFCAGGDIIRESAAGLIINAGLTSTLASMG